MAFRAFSEFFGEYELAEEIKTLIDKELLEELSISDFLTYIQTHQNKFSERLGVFDHIINAKVNDLNLKGLYTEASLLLELRSELRDTLAGQKLTDLKGFIVYARDQEGIEERQFEPDVESPNHIRSLRLAPQNIFNILARNRKTNIRYLVSLFQANNESVLLNLEGFGKGSLEGLRQALLEKGLLEP